MLYNGFYPGLKSNVDVTGSFKLSDHPPS